MEQPITYQQLLAEQLKEAEYFYEQDDEEEQEEFEDINAQDSGVGFRIEDPDAFNKFSGNRNTEELLSRAQNFDDRGRTSVRYNKDVQTRVFNIDTRFRAYATGGVTLVGNSETATNYLNSVNTNVKSSASHFLFRTKETVKNAISVRLSSLELPNRFFNVFTSRGNTSFDIKEYDDENYETIYIETQADIGGYYYNNKTILPAVEKALNSWRPNTFEVERSTDGQTIIRSVDNKRYQFRFVDEVTSPQLYFTLPEALGFQDVYYTMNSSTFSIQSEDAIDMNADTYIYLQINDWATVTPQTANDTYFTVFAKIPIIVDKGQMIVDNDSTNSTLKKYHFLQPTNINLLDIKLVDRLGSEVIMDTHINYSMTLEIEEVVNQSLYEKLREM